MPFVSEEFEIGGTTYTITDEAKAADLAMQYELVQAMNRLARALNK